MSPARFVRPAAAVAVLIAMVGSRMAAQSRPPAGRAAAAPAPAATTQTALTAADLRTRLFLYADDSMLGRETGSIGNAKATAYIAAEARRLGLEPAGDSGGYFQNVPVIRSVLDTSVRLVADTTHLVPFADYLPLTPAVLGGGRWAHTPCWMGR